MRIARLGIFVFVFTSVLSACPFDELKGKPAGRSLLKSFQGLSDADLRSESEAELYLQLMPVLKRFFSSRRTFANADVEDLAHNVYLKMVLDRGKFRGESTEENLLSWAKELSEAEWLEHWKKHTRIHASTLMEPDSGRNEADLVVSGEANHTREEWEERLLALDNPLHREAVILQLNGFNQDQMVQPLGLKSRYEVTQLLKEVREVLRTQFPEEVTAEASPRKHRANRPKGSTEGYRKRNPPIYVSAEDIEPILRGMPDRQRRALWLHLIYGKSQEETIAESKISAGTFSAYLRNLHQLLAGRRGFEGFSGVRSLNISVSEGYSLRKKLHHFVDDLGLSIEEAAHRLRISDLLARQYYENERKMLAQWEKPTKKIQASFRVDPGLYQYLRKELSGRRSVYDASFQDKVSVSQVQSWRKKMLTSIRARLRRAPKDMNWSHVALEANPNRPWQIDVTVTLPGSGRVIHFEVEDSP